MLYPHRRALRRISVLVLVSHLAGLTPAVWAGPEGGVVMGGAAAIDQSVAGNTTITQSTHRAIINWQSFSTSANESVRFAQPSASAVTLNRVTGSQASVLDGSLTANGRVFLLNQNGVLFGKNARVDTAGLVASSLHMADGDFMAGKYELTQPAGAKLGAVVNKGTITTKDGGSVALVAPVVENQGTITAPGGRVSVAAGTKALVSLDEGQLVTMAVTSEPPRDVKVPDGWVSDAVTTVVNNEHLVEAGSVSVKDGEVTLGGAEGIATNLGTIDVSGKPGMNAGAVRIDSSRVTGLASGSVIRANGSDGAHGGEVRVFSEGTAIFSRNARMEAKADGGDGGFLELSGKEHVLVNGEVDATSRTGKQGTFLIDPVNLRIIDGGPGAGSLDGTLSGSGGLIDFFDANGLDTISTGQITSVSFTADIILRATGTIEFQNTGNIGLGDGPGSSGANITFETDATAGSGNIFSSVGDPGDIVAGAGATGSVVFITGGTGSVNLSNLNIDAQSGIVEINAGGNITVAAITFGSTALINSRTGSIIDGNGGTLNFSGNELHLAAAGNIAGINPNRMQIAVNRVSATAGDAKTQVGEIGLFDNDGYRALTVTGGGAVDLGANGNVILGDTGGIGIVSGHTVAITLGAGNLTDGHGSDDGSAQFTNVAAFNSINLQVFGGGAIGSPGVTVEYSAPTVNAMGNSGTHVTSQNDTNLGILSTLYGRVNLQGKGNLLDATDANDNITSSFGASITYPGHIGSNGTPNPIEMSANGPVSLRSVANGEIHVENFNPAGVYDVFLQSNTAFNIITPGSEGMSFSGGQLTGTIGSNTDFSFTLASGNIQLVNPRLTHASADFTIHAQTGSITDDGNDLSFLQANVATLIAAGEIGNLSPSANIDTVVSRIEATSGDGLPGGIGEIAIGDLATGQDVILGSINADGGNQNVRISGARNLFDDGNQATRVTGNLVDLLTAQSIGAGGGAGPAIETAAATLKVSAGIAGDGNIFVDELDGAAIDEIDAFDDGSGVIGDIVLNAGGALTDLDNGVGLDVRGDMVVIASATSVGATGPGGSLETDTNLLTVMSATGGDGGIFVNEIPGSSANGLTLDTLNAHTDLTGSRGQVEVRSNGTIFDGNGASDNIRGAVSTLIIADLEIGQNGGGNEIEIDSVALGAVSGFAASGDLYIRLTNDTALDIVDADGGAGTITLTSVGNITDNNGATVNLIANNIFLNAAANIGGTGAAALETDTNNLMALAGNGSDGGVYINEIGGVSDGNLNLDTANAFADMTGTPGNVELTAAGNIVRLGGGISVRGANATLSAGGFIGQMGPMSSIQTDVDVLTATSGTAGSGGIFITEQANDIAINLLDADSGASSLMLMASGGAIIDNNGPANNIRADFAELAAKTSIGGTGTLAIETDVNSMNAVSGFNLGDGGIYIDELDTLSANGLTLQIFDAFGDGMGTIGDIELTSAGGLFEGNGSTNNLRGGIVTLSAGLAIGDAAAEQQLEILANTVHATSGTVGAGGVFFTELDGVALGLINADGGAGTVNIAVVGGFTDGNGLTNNIRANAATLFANSSIGAAGAGAIDTDVTSLTASAGNGGADGSIFIDELDTGSMNGLAINEINAFGDGAGTPGTVDFNVAGNLTDGNDGAPGTANIIGTAVVLFATGNVGGSGTTAMIETQAVTLNGSGTNFHVNEIGGAVAIGAISASGGTIAITANGAITDTADDTVVDLTASNVILNAGANPIGNLNPNGGIDLAAGTAINGNGSDISYQATGNIVVGAVGASGTVKLVLSNGSVVDEALDDGGDIGAATLAITITGSGGVGNDGNGSIETSVTTALVSVPTGGVVSLHEIAGDILIDSITAANGSVTIKTDAGSVLDDIDDPNADITTGSLTLDITGGVVGGGANGSLDTAVTTVLNIDANGIDVHQQSGALKVGTIDVGAGTILLASNDGIFDEAMDVAADFIAGELTLSTSAGMGIGTDGMGDLDTAVTFLTVTGGTGVAIAERLDGLQIRTVTAIAGTVALHAENGDLIDDMNDPTADVSAPTVTLTVGSGYAVGGTNGSLDINATTLNGTGNTALINDTAGGVAIGLVTFDTSFNLNATGGAITDDTADPTTDINSPNVTLTASGSIGGGAGASLDLDGGVLTASGTSLDISSGGSLDIVTINVGGGSVTLDIGGVLGDNAPDMNVDITAGSLNVVNATDIGSGGNGDLDIDVATVSANAGFIAIRDVGDGFTVGTITSGGPIAIISAGSVLDDGNDPTADISTTGTLSIILGAGNIGGGAALSLDLDVDGQTTLTAANVHVNALGGMQVGAISASGGNVLIDGNGAIVDDVSDPTVDITAASLNFTITGGFGVGGGAGGSLDIDLTGALSGTAASVDINETAGHLRVGSMGAAGAVTLRTAAGDIIDETNDNASDVNAGTLTLIANGGAVGGTNGTFDFSTGLINVQASGATLEQTFGDLAIDLIDVTGGTLSLTAAAAINDDLSDTTPDIIATSASLTAGGTGIGADVSGAVDTNITTLTLATGPNVHIEDRVGNLLIGTVTSAGTVSITAAGAIDDDTPDTMTDISANSLTLTATGFNVGVANGTLDTDVTSLSVTGAQIGIDEASAVTIGTITGTGAITLTAGGAITDAQLDGAADFDTAGTVTLNAAGFNIGFDGNGSVDVNAGLLNATAANAEIHGPGGLTLGLVNATGGNATLTAVGSILDEASDTNADVIAASATLNATGGGDVGGVNGAIDTNVTVLSGTGANVTIQELAGGVQIGSLSAPTGTLTLDVSGSITDDALDVLPDIAASVAVLTATGGSIGGGANGSLDTDIGTLTATAGTADINETNNLLVQSIDVTGGTLALNVAGTLDDAVSDPAADLIASSLTLSVGGGIGLVNGSLDLDVIQIVSVSGTGANLAEVTGNMLVGAINVGTSALALAAPGAIVDDNMGTLNLTAGATTLTAGTGIGAADALETSIASVDAVTATGDIRLAEANGLVVTRALTGAPLTALDGSITISVAAGNLLLGDGMGLPISAENDTVTLITTGGSVVDGNTPLTEVFANLLDVSSSAAIGTAGDFIETSIGTLVSDSIAGTFVSNSGSITLDDVAGAQISISASGDMLLNAVTSATGAVTLVTTAGGSILEGTPGVTDVVASALTLNSSNNIGSIATPLATQAGALSFNAAGTAFLTQSGPAMLDGTMIMGDFGFSVSGTLMVGNVDISGTLVLESTGGAVLDDGNSATVVRASNLEFRGSSVGTATDAIEVDADTITAAIPGAFHVVDVDDVMLSSVTAGGNMSVTAGGDIEVGLVSSGGALSLTSTNGSIFQSATGTLGIGPRAGGPIVAQSASFTAAGDVGSEDHPMLLQVGSLSMDGFSVYARNLGSLNLTEVAAESEAHVIAQGGDLRVNRVSAGDVAILEAPSGSIIDAGPAMNLVAGTALLNAAGTVGGADALDVQISQHLVVLARGSGTAAGTTPVRIDGTVGSGAMTMLDVTSGGMFNGSTAGTQRVSTVFTALKLDIDVAEAIYGFDTAHTALTTGDVNVARHLLLARVGAEFGTPQFLAPIAEVPTAPASVATVQASSVLPPAPAPAAVPSGRAAMFAAVVPAPPPPPVIVVVAPPPPPPPPPPAPAPVTIAPMAMTFAGPSAFGAAPSAFGGYAPASMSAPSYAAPAAMSVVAADPVASWSAPVASPLAPPAASSGFASPYGSSYGGFGTPSYGFGGGATMSSFSAGPVSPYGYSSPNGGSPYASPYVSPYGGTYASVYASPYGGTYGSPYVSPYGGTYGGSAMPTFGAPATAGFTSAAVATADPLAAVAAPAPAPLAIGGFTTTSVTAGRNAFGL